MKFPCLPTRLRWIGIALIAAGSVLGYFWGFAGFKPEWMSFHVFAVYSSYLKTVTFGMTKTNLTDELACFLLLTGSLWLICTKEKEESLDIDRIRYKALISSILLNFVFLLFSIFFIFGIGFLEILIINMFTQPVFYLLVFWLLMWRKNKKNPTPFHPL
jgi:hypothetical protein